ncbi:MAG: thiamine-phosphate kinase [Firmicutes bacterium HGW-Firmicutes-14]|nr:MAG: thiamine-phosphate kinase [Firmicutes bacterium HGW-Firmicutes-14]
MKIKHLGEFGLIERLGRILPCPSDRVIKGIGDDTAVLRPEQEKLVLMTTDMLIEDVHFSLRYFPPRAVGWKALAVNISDIAAMGGLPAQATVSVGIPAHFDIDTIEGIYEGLRECASQYKTDIVGGDTVKSPHGLIINITVLGWVEPELVTYRSGAKPGDIIMVTGPLGSSAAGLFLLNNEAAGVSAKIAEQAVASHLYPRARVDEGRVLSGSGYVTAMNDISDGLAGEILEICFASGAGCELDEAALPISPCAAETAGLAGVTPLEWALKGGEDFELVFTVRPEGVEVVEHLMTEAGYLRPLRVGIILPAETGCCIMGKDGRAAIGPGGFNHFR